jgi:hypothetical protein
MKEKDKPTKLDDFEASLKLDDAGFYPFTSLPPALNASDSSQSFEDVPYGHLAYRREIVLSISQISQLVKDVAQVLTRRGLQVPFLFSSQAIDLNPAAVRKLINSFLFNSSNDEGSLGENWTQDTQFANPHELGMILRWGLATVMRRGGRRGLLDFVQYLIWKDLEIGEYCIFFKTLLTLLTPLDRSRLSPNIYFRVLHLSSSITRSANFDHLRPTLITSHSL